MTVNDNLLWIKGRLKNKSMGKMLEGGCNHYNTTLSFSTHYPVNDDTRYVYAWIDHEIPNSQRA